MFQLHVSIYVSITSISTKGIILFHNYKFVSRVDFTKSFTSVLRRIIIGLASWQLSIYTSLNSHSIEQSEAQSQANKNTHTHYTSMCVLLVIPSSNIDILVILSGNINIPVILSSNVNILLISTSIYLRFINKLRLFVNWV